MRAHGLRSSRLAHGLIAAVVAASCDGSPTPPMTVVDAAPVDPSMCPREEAVWEDIAPGTFTPLRFPGAERLTLYVEPSTPATYWELRRYSPASPVPQELAVGGDKCTQSSNPVQCRAQFNALTPFIEGFGQDGGPEQYESHLAVNRGDSNAILSTRRGLAVFLGEINTPAEAVLLAHADGFTVESVRETEDGYELLVTERTQFCAPIVVQRVLLFVARDGSATEQRRQNASVDCFACL